MTQFLKKYLKGNDPSIVDVDEDTIIIPNHFFVSGESIKYYNTGVDPPNLSESRPKILSE